MKNNFKGIVNNTVGYTGIVTLSQYTGTKKRVLASTHNEGGKALFDYLADCLAGNFDTANINRPTKIMLLNITEDAQPVNKALNTSFIYLLTNPEKVYSETEGVVRYSFTVPHDMLIGTSFNAIGLYPASATESDLADYAAICNIEVNTNSLSLSSVLVLDWELHMSNIYY